MPERALRPGDAVLLREEVFPVRSTAVDWRNWASALGLPCDLAARIVRYSTFGEAISAALGGAGVALGRSPLIDPALNRGGPVRLVPELSRLASWRFILRRGPSRRHRMWGR